jgi:hypothetical protein
MIRLAGRRTGRRCRPRPTATPTITSAIPAGWPRNWRRPNRTARSGPTSSTTSPTARRMWRPPARDLGADRRQGRRLHLRRRLGRHAGRRGAGAAAEGREDRPRRPRGRGALQLLHHRRAEGRGAPRSPKASARAASPPTSKASPPISPIASPMPRRCPSSSTCWSDEGLCMGGSTGINVAGAIRMAREMGPGHTIVTILCDYGTATSPSCSTRPSCASKGLPVPGWLDCATRSPPSAPARGRRDRTGRDRHPPQPAERRAGPPAGPRHRRGRGAPPRRRPDPRDRPDPARTPGRRAAAALARAGEPGELARRADRAQPRRHRPGVRGAQRLGPPRQPAAAAREPAEDPGASAVWPGC